MYKMDAYKELSPIAEPQYKELHFDSTNTNSTKHLKPVRYGGGFSFKGSHVLQTATRNRFIYWRILGPALELRDVSFDFHITDGALKMVFQNSNVACEPGIFETEENTIILVTTTTGIYRFQFPLPDFSMKDDSERRLPSIFSGATRSSVLSDCHMFPGNLNVAAFACASLCHSLDGSSYFAFSYQPGDVVWFKMSQTNTFNLQVTVSEAKQPGVVSRLLGGFMSSAVWNGTDMDNACSDMCMLQGPTEEMLVCAVTWNFRLKIWSADTCELLVNEDMFAQASGCTDRHKAIAAGSKNMIRKHVKELDNGEVLILLGAYLNIPNNTQFQVYQLCNLDTAYSAKRIISYYDCQEELIDFELDSEMFWAAWTSKGSGCIVKFEYLTLDTISTWSSAVMGERVEDGLNISSSVDPRQLYVDHLFDPRKFGSDSVVRALSSYANIGGYSLTELKSLSRKELKIKACLAVEDQVRDAAAEFDTDIQESEYLQLQVHQWSTLYTKCYVNEERNRKVLGLFRDDKTGLVLAIKERCYSLMAPGSLLDQYHLEGSKPPTLDKFKRLYPSVQFESNTCKHFGYVLKCMDRMSLPPGEDAWAESFGTAFVPVVVAKKHARFLLLATSRDFVNYVNRLESWHYSAMKVMIELLEVPPGEPAGRSYHDVDVADQVKASEELLETMFASPEGLKVLTDFVRKSNDAKYVVARNLLVIAIFLREHTEKVIGDLIPEFEEMIGHLSVLVGSFHLIVWCATKTVRASDLCCIDKTKRSLDVLGQFKHDSDFNLLESEENSMTLVELFLVAQGREEIVERFSEHLRLSSDWKLCMQGVSALADFVSMCLMPNYYGSIFPLVLFNCCQHLHLQQYISMVQKFYFENIGTLNFLLGLTYLTTNEQIKAFRCFKEVRNHVAAEEFLLQLLSDSDPIYMETDYLIKVMNLFEEFENPALCVDIARHAIELADADDPYIETIWSKVFRCELELGRYDEAYEALFRNPEQSRQKDCLRQFLTVLYEKKDYGTIVNLNYRSRESFLENEAIGILEARARSADVLKHDFYDLLYAFHVQRKNYRCAANVMYECAHRWGQEVSGLEGLKKMVEHLNMCHNCLLLVDRRNAWVVKPSLHGRALDVTSGPDTAEKKKGRRSAKSAVEVLDEEAIKKELMLSSSLLAIHASYGEASRRKTTAMIPMRAVAMRAGEVALLLCHAGLYARAFRLSRLFALSLVPVYESLVVRCIEMSCKFTSLDPSLLDDIDTKHQLDWIEFNEDDTYVMSKKYTTASDRAWRILQTNLEKSESPSSTRGLRCCAVKMFHHGFILPSWFKAMYQITNPSELMNLYAEYGCIQEAADLALQYVEAVAGKGKDNFGLKDYLHAGSEEVWLPYRVIDGILNCLDNLPRPSSSLTRTRCLLKEALNKHFKLVEHSGQARVYTAV